jgi:negative regulator of sigma E activity
MSEPRDQWSEDLLSAYADGEVTDDERALVETRLAESPSLRAVLDEIEAARDAVRSLPQRDAPPEFWARVLDGTGLDAEAVLAPLDADAASAPVVALGAHRSKRLSRWVAVVGGAAAAAVVAAVILVPSPKRVDPPVASFTDAHAVRNSLDSDAVSSLAPLALQAGFRR